MSTEVHHANVHRAESVLQAVSAILTHHGMPRALFVVEQTEPNPPVNGALLLVVSLPGEMHLGRILVLFDEAEENIKTVFYSTEQVIKV